MARPALPTLAFEVREDISLIVLRHGPSAPAAAEWSAFLDAVRGKTRVLEQMRVLIVTDGARPERAQQARLNDILGGRSIRTAVVSSSMAVTFVVSVFALFNPGIRGFGGSQLAGAFEYLGLGRSERSEAEAAVRRLSRVVGVAMPDAAAAQRDGT